jgi:DNA repair/transcription protein MET18/MMS19
MLLVDSNELAAADVVQDIAGKLESKQTNLVDVVQSLSEYINDEDLVTRSKPVQYLSDILKTLSPSFLSNQQVLVLCQFFCDRIEDGGAISGIQRLQSSGRFNKEMAATTFRA